jgi:hypothetical protein
VLPFHLVPYPSFLIGIPAPRVNPSRLGPIVPYRFRVCSAASLCHRSAGAGACDRSRIVEGFSNATFCVRVCTGRSTSSAFTPRSLHSSKSSVYFLCRASLWSSVAEAYEPEDPSLAANPYPLLTVMLVGFSYLPFLRVWHCRPSVFCERSNTRVRYLVPLSPVASMSSGMLGM